MTCPFVNKSVCFDGNGSTLHAREPSEGVKLAPNGIKAVFDIYGVLSKPTDFLNEVGFQLGYIIQYSVL